MPAGHCGASAVAGVGVEVGAAGAVDAEGAIADVTELAAEAIGAGVGALFWLHAKVQLTISSRPEFARLRGKGSGGRTTGYSWIASRELPASRSARCAF